MKIALIAPNPTFQTEDLEKEASSRNHTCIRIKLSEIDVTNTQTDKTIQELLEYDVVLFRNGADRVTKMILGKALHNRKRLFINSGYFKDPLLSDKFYQTHMASQARIKVPKTFSLKESAPGTYKRLTEKLGSPFIMKPTTGAQGFGVKIISSEGDYARFSKRIFKTLIQEYIPNDGDYRVLVIGHKAIGTYKRIPPKGDFRANISQGGSGKKVTDKELSKRLMEMAEKVTPLFNLEIAGIDIIKSKNTDELYFIESNSIPQWQGFKATTGINVAGKIIDYFENCHNGE
ncbi:MAG: ATP-grasp domain-containing protein [Candidatus Dojkabacteria bacterium]|nr:ATP-grasp domain-containing protein [Candidatus Dojkabacteria bacterium]